MENPSRRKLIRAAVPVCAALAGCSSLFSPGTHEIEPSSISASATVVNQPTDATPPTLELGLTNTGDQSVPVRSTNDGGYPMEGVFAWGSDDTDFVWIPPSSDHVGISDHPDSRRNGCWRLPSDSDHPYVVSSFPHKELAPGETHTETQYVYHDGSPDSCFAPGDYEIDAAFVLAEQDQQNGPEFNLTYTLSITADKQFSISVAGPN